MMKDLIAKLLGTPEQPKPSETLTMEDYSPEVTDGAKEPKASTKAKTKGLPIGRVNINLTPEFYKEAVYARQLKKQWIFINAGIVALAALVLSFIFVSGLPAKSNLENQMVLNKNLQSALVEYQDITILIDQKSATENKLIQAAGNEIDWSKLIDSIQNTLPNGTSISSIGITTTDSSNKEVGATILVQFVAKSPLGYADTLRSVQTAKGISNVEISGMSSTGESYQFSATMNYDHSIKTNRFSEPSVKTGK